MDCCWHMSRDVVRAVAFVALLVGSAVAWVAALALQPAWAADPGAAILRSAWFPCGLFAAAALVAALGAVVTLGTCRRGATAPVHLVRLPTFDFLDSIVSSFCIYFYFQFTGALAVLLPLQLAVAAAVAADAAALRQLAAADATGALQAALDWVAANPGAAGAAAGAWFALQAAALAAGLWVAACAPRGQKAPFYRPFDPEVAAGGSLHAPLLGNGGRGGRGGHHQRRGSASSAGGGLTPRSPLGERALGPGGGHHHQGPQVPVIVLPTTGLQ